MGEWLKAEGGVVEHLDGIPWYEAPRPRRWHRCKPQTRGHSIARCACGAIWILGGWVERNSRRRR